jgi:hypothetical protein
VRLCGIGLLIALGCAAGSGTEAQAPGPKEEPPPAGVALDWDRDFDLILESRQGAEREVRRRNARLEAIQKEMEGARAEEADLVARLKILADEGAGESALEEMLRLDAPSPDRARAILNARLEGVRERISDLEDDMKRAERVR